MLTSTITGKGRTTVPQEIRKALGIKPHQSISWMMQANGTVIVRLQPSALDLFSSLKSSKKFQGLGREREVVRRAIAQRALKHQAVKIHGN